MVGLSDPKQLHDFVLTSVLRGDLMSHRKSGVLFLIGLGVLRASHCQAVIVPAKEAAKVPGQSVKVQSHSNL